MTGYRRAIAKLRLAESLLAPYVDSRREMVADTASGTRLIYSSLVVAFEGALRTQESLVDAKPGQPLGRIVSETSKHTAMVEDAWRALPIAVAAGLSHALVDSDRTTGDGRRDYLVIAERERADLLQTIELLFGSDVASGKAAAGLHPPEASASLLARFLREAWRASDQK